MTHLIIVGYKGRMGQALITCAERDSTLKIVGRVDQGDDLSAVMAHGHVVIDFSFHTVTPAVVALCLNHRKPLVIGTTGHSEPEKQSIVTAATELPIVWASNFSTGVNTLFWLTRRAAEVLGPGYDLEIVEMHHRTKKDAPSGTATTLAEILAEVRQHPLQETLRHGRHGITGERTAAEIGMHSIRGGDVVGDHTVIFAAPGERVELTHRASNRETFANGAMRAARWLIGKPPGLYNMQDVLGLK